MVKRILIISIILLVLFNSISLGVSLTDAVSDQVSFSDELILSNAVITDEKQSEYVTVDFDEANAMLLNPGKPMLPVLTKSFTFPVGTKIDTIQVTIETEQLVLHKKIQPAPQPVTDDAVQLSSDPTLKMDETVYSSESWYPQKAYTVMKNAGLQDDNRVMFVHVKVFPQYNPGQNSLLIPSTVKIDISYQYEEQLSKNDMYDLLIITDKRFENKLAPLVEHKNNHGIDTVMATTQTIYREYDGRDHAEEVKLYIKDAIENWNISYVLLAGGRKRQTQNWYVPVRMSNNQVHYGEEDRGYATDLYFADVYKIGVDDQLVFEDWDSNGNDVFAENTEWRQDIIDYHPDVAVGRAPFRNRYEVDVFVNKVIQYENMQSKPWFNKMIAIGGDTHVTHGDHFDIYEGEVQTNFSASFLEPIGFDIEKVWLSDDECTWDGPEDIVNILNEGAGFVHMAGHGNPAVWGTHRPYESSFVDGLRVRDISTLSNSEKLPVFVIGGCHNARFDVTMSNLLVGLFEYGVRGMFFQHPRYFHHMEWIPRDFCSSLLFTKNGGGIASMGFTGLGYSSVGEHGDLDNDNITEPDCIEALGGWITTRFFQAYAEQDKTVLGSAHQQAITDYIMCVGNYYPGEPDEINENAVDRKMIEAFSLIGDPSLQIGVNE